MMAIKLVLAITENRSVCGQSGSVHQADHQGSMPLTLTPCPHEEEMRILIIDQLINSCCKRVKISHCIPGRCAIITKDFRAGEMAP